MTDKELNTLDDGVEFIVKTDKGVLDKMNAWSVPLTSSPQRVLHSSSCHACSAADARLRWSSIAGASTSTARRA